MCNNDLRLWRPIVDASVSSVSFSLAYCPLKVITVLSTGMPSDKPELKEIELNALNPRFKQAYAISKRIPTAKNKRLAILAWCKAAKKAIG